MSHEADAPLATQAVPIRQPPRDPGAGRSIPLLVRLEGQLVRVNLEHEALSSFVLSRPLTAGRLLLSHGRLKQVRRAATELAQREPPVVPFDQATLEHLREESARGRRLLLLADAQPQLAAHVADELGLFEAIVTSDQIGSLGPHEGIAAPVRRRPAPRDLLHALRPHQWLKNLLVLVALFTAQEIEQRTPILHALTMFLAFCLVSSSVYVLNDLADLGADRRHVSKFARPLASGAIGVLAGWLLWPVLLGLGAALAIVALPPAACLWLLAYYAGTIAYTFGAKRVAVLDVILLAGLYTVRIIAGAAAISVPTSIWLLTFSMSIFTSLALVKRVSELTRVIESGGVLRGRGYEPRDLATLKSLGVTASYAAVVVLALYVHDPGTAMLYRTPSILWLVVPLLLYWTSRLWLLADRGEIDEDPLLFATRDRVSYVVLLTTAAAFIAAKFIG